MPQVSFVPETSETLETLGKQRLPWISRTQGEADIRDIRDTMDTKDSRKNKGRQGHQGQ